MKCLTLIQCFRWREWRRQRRCHCRWRILKVLALYSLHRKRRKKTGAMQTIARLTFDAICCKSFSLSFALTPRHNRERAFAFAFKWTCAIFKSVEFTRLIFFCSFSGDDFHSFLAHVFFSRSLFMYSVDQIQPKKLNPFYFESEFKSPSISLLNLR